MPIIFVFGSNERGVHGAGAALSAHRDYGAEWGVGEGRTGNAYAIPTKDRALQTRALPDIEKSIERFALYARENPELRFLVTPVGCGLAGYNEQDIRPLFDRHGPYSNCRFCWREY